MTISLQVGPYIKVTADLKEFLPPRYPQSCFQDCLEGKYVETLQPLRTKPAP